MATLNGDVFTEILLRLPPKSVLRCRAVCKLWQSIATCASFVAAYSRRRPLELIVYPSTYEFGPGNKNVIAAVNLDDGGTGCRRLLHHDGYLTLFGSCDGLLLFSEAQKSFLICNPATRQLARLPALTPKPCMNVLPSGFYFHTPSGEHRVLCIGHDQHKYIYDPLTNVSTLTGDTRPVHYVLSTGATEPRRLGHVDQYPGYHVFPEFGVAVGGSLHWVKHPQIGKNSQMLVFDTVSEAFRRMSLPSITGSEYHDFSLFDMHGTLAASVLAEWPYLQVWALDGGKWSCRLRVELPAHSTLRQFQLPGRGPSRRDSEAVSRVEGHVLVVFSFGWVLRYDMKEKRMLSEVDQGDNCALPRWYLHRESLVPVVLNGQPFQAGDPILHTPLIRRYLGRSCGCSLLGYELRLSGCTAAEC